jgi:hypothetical protein
VVGHDLLLGRVAGTIDMSSGAGVA